MGGDWKRLADAPIVELRSSLGAAKSPEVMMQQKLVQASGLLERRGSDPGMVEECGAWRRPEQFVSDITVSQAQGVRL